MHGAGGAAGRRTRALVRRGARRRRRLLCAWVLTEALRCLGRLGADLGVDVGFLGDDGLHHLGQARPRRLHQRCPAPLVHHAATAITTKRQKQQQTTQQQFIVIDDDINTMSFTTLLSAQIAEW